MKRALIPLLFFLLFQACYETELPLREILQSEPVSHFEGNYRSQDGEHRLSIKTLDQNRIHYDFETISHGRRYRGVATLSTLGQHKLIAFSGPDTDSPLALAILSAFTEESGTLAIQLLKTNLPAAVDTSELEKILAQSETALEPAIIFQRLG